MDKWEDKLAKMAEICGQENVTSILGVPTWTIVLLDRIMEERGAKNMLEVWPNFEVFIHGAVAFQPYRELFMKKYFPSEKVTYMETYNASEGFFAVQDDLAHPGEMLLMLDYGIFYEFVPVEEWDNPHTPRLSLWKRWNWTKTTPSSSLPTAAYGDTRLEIPSNLPPNIHFVSK
jgi:hypothetical protein